MANSKSGADLRDDERLGRRVFSRRQQGDRRLRWRAFYDWKARSLSVDCLDRAALAELVELGTRAAESRAGARAFYGWLAIMVAAARLHGRTVRATPRPDNPFHADIDLPGVPGTDEERKTRARKHAQLLAEQASFAPTTSAARSVRRKVRAPRRGLARSQ